MDDSYYTAQSERERNRAELDRVRNFSGANFSKHFAGRRMTTAAAGPARPIMPPPNPFRIWNDFSVKPILFKIKNPSYNLQEIIKVKILDPSTLSYPINFLEFCSADNNKILEYVAQSLEINEIYKSVSEVTSQHILTSQYIMKGNVAIIMEHGLYKRAQILASPKPKDKYKRVFCYLLDEGIETVVRENCIFRAIKDLWTLPPRIMKFRMAGLRRYENMTEFRQLLIQEFGVKPEREYEWELSAEIISKKLDGSYKIILNSTKYPNQSINEIILRNLFDCFDMKTILSSTDFYPTVQLMAAQKNGNILLQLDTPVFRHLHQLMTNNKQFDRFTAAQKNTDADGFLKKNECYIYWNLDKRTCFRVVCTENSTTKSDEVDVLFIDYGIVYKVNKMRLAHVKYLRNVKLPFDVFAIIPPQSIKAHLAGIDSMNFNDFNDLLDRKDNFYLRKIQRLGELSSFASAEVELFSDCMNNVPVEQPTSLNKLVLKMSTETQGRLVSKDAPMTYYTREFSSFAPVRTEGANWGTPNGKFVPLQVGETLEIIVIGDGEHGQLFVRSAYAYTTALMDTIHKQCQSYLADYKREESLCNCMMDGYHFVVETEYECTRFHRIRVLDRELQPIVKDKDPQWNLKPIESRPKKVECLFIDRGDYRTIPVEDLRVMNPAVAMYPAQGALAIWICDEYNWRHDDWKRFVNYATNRRFKAKVLSLTQDSFGRFRFEMNLYKMADTKTDATNVLLCPRDRFWETRNKSSSKFNFSSRRKNNKEYIPSLLDLKLELP